MTTLAQLSEARLAPGLDPVIAEFAPGQPLPERLLVARDAALAALQQYVPDLKYDRVEAAEQVREIDDWAERNRDGLAAVMASPAEELPAKLQLQMGADRAQQFVIASFTQAALGLGAWASGAVASAAEDPSAPVNEMWARADAQQRLQMFALIVKMDREGTLRTIFLPPQAASGLGAIPLWFIAVVLVILAAAVVTSVVLIRRLELNNRLLRDLCEEERRKGNHQAFQVCIEATKELQGSPLEQLPKQVVYAAFAAGGVYALAKYGVPWLLNRYEPGAKRALAKRGWT